MQKNVAQEQVINEVYGQIIVIACPGSGKTTTLLRRINHMVEDLHINPSEILMITFTKAAAGEMGQRYAEKFGGNPGITFSTIHSLCFSILKQFKGYTFDNILTDAQDLIFNSIKHDNTINDKAKFIDDALMDISVVKGNQLSMESYKPQCCDDKRMFKQIYQAYENSKKELEKIDFDDILIECYELLKNDRDILDMVRDRFGYIHVDEYQDTNYIQRDIVYLITGPNGNLTVVGDDDQSIYSFRGAKPEIMLNFKKDYPDAKEIYMSTNYRSDKVILDGAAKLIEFNSARYPKDIIAFNSGNGKITHVPCLDKWDEMEYVGDEIARLIQNGEKPSDIAVLFRTNAQSGLIGEALSERNIPFFTNEPIENKYNHWMYRDILAYHKMTEKTGSKADYIKTITHPNRFIPKIDTRKTKFTVEHYKAAANNPYIEEWKNKKIQDNVQHYFDLLELLGEQRPEEFMELLGKTGGYENYLIEYSDFRGVPLFELQNIWESYKKDIKRKGLDTFQKWDAYVNKYNLFMQSMSDDSEGVCLSTMHKSKGLEWKYVFIIDCVTDICPFQKAKTVEEIEEERRLFYVAATRAKNFLYLCSYRQSKSTKIDESIFITEYLR